ncbi:lytic transglycosylase domain-containing protein [Agromyces intestinalis]|uniref:aggregation-promoting factor C-terminal-like domain-containing protein n=1 Tax=Agromyces intestinalis TaxID=2592652 RepID=UPI001FEA7E02|nr:lytic transglycosylase domain-containing protein [Agromyces intestinalis]
MGTAPTSREPIRGGVRSQAKQTAVVLFASFAVFGLVFVNMVDPYGGASASAGFRTGGPLFGADAQRMTASGEYQVTVSNESYSVELKPEQQESTAASSGWAPPAVTPDPGSAQAYAAEAVAARGWPGTEFDCLVALWAKESGWRVNAYNAGSGAYGIPQALPGSKMASAGADWETNAATQVEWGLGYVQGRYGTPCGAWAHSQDSGWY